MSSPTVKKFKRVYKIAGTGWANGILTVTTTTAHYLLNGDTVQLLFNSVPQFLTGVVSNAGTAGSSSTFDIACPSDYNIVAGGEVTIDYFTNSTEIIPLTGRSGVNNSTWLIHSYITGTGAVSATINWYGNSDNSTVGAVSIGTTSLSGTDIDASAAIFTAQWPIVYGVISAISGTGAKIVAKVVG